MFVMLIAYETSQSQVIQRSCYASPLSTCPVHTDYYRLQTQRLL